MANNHDWLSLVNLSGLLVSEPVLNDVFPDGPPALAGWQARRFRAEYERWLATQDRGRWTSFIFSLILGYAQGRLRAGMSLPPEVRVDLADYMQRLSPDRALMGPDGEIALLVYFAEGDLDKPEVQTGRWKASPFTKLDRLLRETGVPLGLLTNGNDWRLVYAAPGLTTSSIAWSAATWLDESLTLRAFRMLLADPAKLQEMASESQQRQADVTDQLGNQVLRALAILVHELDRADAASERSLLSDMTPEQVYEMALVLMMRLVFMLYAEENNLLPHGEVFYDQGYGLTFLWNRLERERREDSERFRERRDAWPRLLATFNLIYDGSPHKDFVMPAYRGSLFDPGRFPALLSPYLNIDNRTIWRMLRHLTTAENRDGRQRVSYRTLNVEQLGYVYEGLLGYTVKVAKEWMIDPEGGLEPFPLTSYQDALAAGELYEYLKTITGVHWTQARGWSEEIEQRAESGSDDVFWVWEPVAEMWIEPGGRYLAPEMGTRKRGGIFYTPPQLTSFLVEQALEPQCTVEDDSGDKKVRSAREILSLTVCDPAMGSGAFLVQAVRYLGDRLLEAWDAAIAGADGAKLVMPFAERAGRALEDAGPIPADRDEALIWARRLVAERCIYGVDLNALAVELAKLSLWLVTLSKDKPFTFLDHRLRHGNSLIGASFLQETELEVKQGRATGRRTVRQIAYIPDAALSARKGADKDEKAAARERIKTNQAALFAITGRQMGIFADMGVEHALAALADRQRDLTTPTTRPDDYRTKEDLLAQVLHQGDYPRLKEIADLWCAVWFWPRDVAQYGPPPATGEYHDAVYAILDLPAIITTSQPRLDQLRATACEVAAREHFFHWELAYPAIFTRENPGFDAMCGNPPWDIVQEDDHSADAEGLKEWFKWDQYSILSGRRDLYKLFTVLGLRLINSYGLLGLVTPIGMFIEDDSYELRTELYRGQGILARLQHFQNHGKLFFRAVHASYRFAILIYRASGNVDHTYSTVVRSPENINDAALATVKRDELANHLGDDLGAILFPSERYYDIHLRTIERLRDRQLLEFTVVAEFHATSDKDLGVEQPDDDSWQTLKNRSIHQFNHRFADGGWSISLEAVAERCIRKQLDPHLWTGGIRRLLFRDIARNDDARTLICCLAPRGYVSTYDTPMVVPSLDDVEQLPIILAYVCGLLNSFTFDFLIRPFVDKHIKGYVLKRLPIPAFEPSYSSIAKWTLELSDKYPRIGSLSPLERSRLLDTRAKLEAFVARIAGLSEEEVGFVLDTFPIVREDEEKEFGEYRTKRRILEFYRMIE